MSVDSQLENNYQIIEAVARFHFAKERYGSEIAYISVFGEGPPSRFIKRFNDLEVEVLPGSKHEISKRPYLFGIWKINTDSESAIVEAQDYFDDTGKKGQPLMFGINEGKRGRHLGVSLRSSREALPN